MSEIPIQQISMEEMILIQQRKIIHINNNYIKNLEKGLKTLKKLMEKKDRDRLDNAFILVSMITIMKASIDGWIKWCNVQKMQDIFEDEKLLKEFVDTIMELVVKWITADIDITRKNIKDIEKDMIAKAMKITKTKKPRKHKNHKKTTYVA